MSELDAERLLILQGVITLSQCIVTLAEEQEHSSERPVLIGVAGAALNSLGEYIVERIEDPQLRTQHRQQIAELTALLLPLRAAVASSGCDPLNDPSWGVQP